MAAALSRVVDSLSGACESLSSVGSEVTDTALGLYFTMTEGKVSCTVAFRLNNLHVTVAGS